MAPRPALGDAYFATPEMKALVATWGMHLDFKGTVAAGAVGTAALVARRLVGGRR
jgi:hypothetical protein